MAKGKEETVICKICKNQKDRSEMISGELVREPIAEMIRKDHPDWSTSDFICQDDLNQYRAKYVQQALEMDRGELTGLDKEVVRSLAEQEVMTRDLNAEFESKLTFGQQLADKIASFGGSWGFISIFMGVLVIWIAINSIALLHRPFDPFPFILLNLVLSCLAAIQAPVIMMSQNRQESKDRLRAEHDYRVNLKAELEIRNLHEKIDHLLDHQWQRLLEIQQTQMDLMEELVGKKADH